MKIVTNPDIINKVLENAPNSTNPKIQASLILATWLRGAGASADVQALAARARVDAINSPNPETWLVALLAGLAIRGFAPLLSVADQFQSSITDLGATLVSNTATDLLTVSLAPGDWDVEGNINFLATGATVTALSGGVTAAVATVPTDSTEIYSGIQSTTTSFNDSITIPRKRFNITAATTVKLVCKAVFSAGSIETFGAITARRVS